MVVSHRVSQLVEKETVVCHRGKPWAARAKAACLPACQQVAAGKVACHQESQPEAKASAEHRWKREARPRVRYEQPQWPNNRTNAQQFLQISRALLEEGWA